MMATINLSNEENYHIEEVDSDNESKVKGLCVEKGNKIVVNLSRSKRKFDEKDNESNRSSKRKSLNNSNEFNVSVYKNLSELINKYDDRSGNSSSSSVHVTPARKPLKKSPKRRQNESFEKSLNKSSNSPIVLKKSNIVSHSTPKVHSKIQDNNDKIIENFSPLKNDAKDVRRIDSALKPISQNINIIDSSIYPRNLRSINRSNKVNIKPKSIVKSRSKPRTLFNSTNRNFDENQPIEPDSNSPVKALSQTIFTPQSPEPLLKLKKQAAKSPLDFKRKKLSSAIKLNPHKTPHKKHNSSDQKIKDETELTPIKSQIISQVNSPSKEQMKVFESRCFLKWSKKIEKQMQQHNLIKMNVSKNSNSQLKNTLVYRLMDSIYERKEQQANFLGLNKKEDVQRSSLFIRLTKVRAPNGGFVVCDCAIDLERSTEVILFKYDKLKTLIPIHYANEFDLSNNAVLEFVGPWSVFDCETLSTSFVMNPFWIHILDHGKEDDEESEYEIEYENPN